MRSFSSFTVLFLLLAVQLTSGSNACNNTRDLLIITKTDQATFNKEITSCAKGCMGKSSCSATCIEKDLKLSSACSQCFGDEIGCGTSHCFLQCIRGPTSKSCIDCTTSHCQAGFVTCSGLPTPAMEAHVAVVAAPQGGACQNTADMAIIHTADNDTSHAFHKEIETCARSCFGQAVCSSKCINSKTKLSTACSNCFGDDVGCGAKQCASQCLANPDSAACLKCNKDKCQPGLVKCSGIPDGDIPTLALTTSSLAGALGVLPANLFASGSCNNTDDLLKIGNLNASGAFHSDIKSCATKCFGSASCSTTCIQQNTKISQACATCFGTDVGCGASKCRSQCIFNQESQKCLDCVKSNCEPALVTCSGIPESEIPTVSDRVAEALVGVAKGGACNNTKDMLTIRNLNSSGAFHGDIKSCATKCFGSASCSTTCIQQNTKISQPCATCFGDDVGCGASKCRSQCIFNQESPKCLKCVKDNCEPALVTCSGIPEDEIPTFSEHVAVGLIEAANGDACNNTADRVIIAKADKDTSHTFHKTIEGCARSCLGAAACSSKCINQKLGLSTACSGCFGQDVGCSASKCKSKCFFNPDSAACLQCAKDECEGGLVACSGIPSSEIPSFYLATSLSISNIIGVLPVGMGDVDTTTQKPEMLGGMSKDDHGCVTDGGFQWCESNQKCQRPWMEACPPTQAEEETGAAELLKRLREEHRKP